MSLSPIINTIENVKPKNKTVSAIYGSEQFFTVTVNAGQSMGLLLAITYPAGFTVTTSKHY